MTNDFFSEFDQVPIEAWEERLKRDLKGESLEDKLHYTDEIEGLNFKAYSHHEEFVYHHSNPGKPNYIRGIYSSDNQWKHTVKVPYDHPKKMNEQALFFLMNGANGLIIDFKEMPIEDCKTVLNEIQLKYITATFYYHTKEQKKWLKALSDNNDAFNGAILGQGDLTSTLIPFTRSKEIDGTQVQRAGGNSMQEIAYLLHVGHRSLFDMIENGMSIDEAAPKLHFKIGVGNNYFVQIAKQRIFRRLWAEVVSAYKPDHDCSKAAYVQCEVGLLNKSLEDPHTNLLRQTTEAMSAIIGGTNELYIQPYNARAKNPDLKNTQRLALNIGLILQEEAYFDKVIDPSGGSFSIEQLSEELQNKTWSLFQEVEKKGLDSLKTVINKTKLKRIEKVEKNENTLIGINVYKNESKNPEKWHQPIDLEMGEELILERDCQLETVNQ